MDRDKLRLGILPGIIAGYIALGFHGAGFSAPVMDAAGAEIGTASGMGILERVGGTIGADALIGFILYVIIGAAIGALYTGLFTPNVDLGNPLLNIAVGGLIYGVIWWVVGANLIAPVIAGGDALQLSLGPDFYAHIIYGHALAFIVVLRDLVLKANQ